MSSPLGSSAASSSTGTGTGASGQPAATGMDSSVVDGSVVDASAVDGSVQDARADAVDADPELPATGDQSVDEAVEALLGVLQRSLGEQVDVYAEVHGRLQDRLADLDG